MLLAEMEIFHSRPIAPTRRLSIGHLILPVDPAPGFGGLLLAAVVSVYSRDIDEDLMPDVQRLLLEIENGTRVVQPRLRHRFQVDRHGLSYSTHRLYKKGDSVEFDLSSTGTPLQQVLGAIYAIERFEEISRKEMVALLRKSMMWRGPIGPSFINYLVGARSSHVSALADPRAWALEILGFPAGTVKPAKREVMARFREALRLAHPDHGGDEASASQAIVDITEARRVLLEK